jgi:toxin-antitoxin system PIN domain toxin
MLYAVNRASTHHAAVKQWLDAALSSDETLGVPWVSALGFLRIATNPRAMTNPLTTGEALAFLNVLFAFPNVVQVSPGQGHWALLHDLIAEVRTAGNLTTDAHLAALAIEHGAGLCSADSDFSRFKA